MNFILFYERWSLNIIFIDNTKLFVCVWVCNLSSKKVCVYMCVEGLP